MQQQLTDRTRAVLHLATAHAQQQNAAAVRPIHLLVALADEHDNTAAHLLSAHGVTAPAIHQYVSATCSPTSHTRTSRGGHLPFTTETRSIVKRSRKHAAAFESRHIDPEHVLLAVLDSEDEEVCATIAGCTAISMQQIADDLIELLLDEAVFLGESEHSTDDTSGEGGAEYDFVAPVTSEMHVEVGGSPYIAGTVEGDGVLQDLPFVRDLTAGGGSEIYGRDGEIDRLIEILGRRRKSNALLVGAAGVGKTAIVEGVAHAIASGQAPQSLRATRVWELDVASLMAGTKHRGDFEDRIRALVDAATQDPHVVVFIDEMHVLLGAGSGSSGAGMNAADLLKPALSRGDLRVVGATTPDEQRLILSDEALSRRFAVIDVEEMSADNTARLLFITRDIYEKHHRVTLSDDAVWASVRSAQQCFPHRSLPDSAIDVLDEACASAGIRQSSEVTAEFVSQTASAMSGVPVHSPTGDETQRLRSLRDTLADKVQGQQHAVDVVSRAVWRSRTGIASLDRPVASLLFTGPPGVGKTHMAKVLAEEVFGDPSRLVTVDLGSFSELGSASRLFGAPPGYVGHDDGGELTNAVRRTPHCVVLLDEADKAHPSVLDAFLQVLESGILTDGSGRVTDFRHTIIIMTANTTTRNESGFGGGQSADISARETASVRRQGLSTSQLVDELGFRVEMVNRFDEIVPFRPLDREALEGAVRARIKNICDLLQAGGTTVVVDDAVIRWLGAQARNGDVGARGVRRAIAQHVENPVSDAIITHSGAVKGRIHVTLATDQDSPVEHGEGDSPVRVAVSR